MSAFSGKKIASKVRGEPYAKILFEKISRTKPYYIFLKSLICGEYKTANYVE